MKIIKVLIRFVIGIAIVLSSYDFIFNKNMHEGLVTIALLLSYIIAQIEFKED
jgi:hypothetical protein